MVEHDQTNIRIPEAAKKVVKTLAARLREDAGLIQRLARFLDEDAAAGRTPFMIDRIERLEARVADLSSRVDRVAPRAAGTPTQLDMLASDTKPAKPHKPAVASTATSPGQWTSGEGRGRRLTAEGEAEMRRLIAEGQSDREISDALGVRPFTVGNQRRRITSDTEERVSD